MSFSAGPLTIGLGEHAARGVNRDQDIEPALPGLFPGETPLRLRQSHENRRHGRDQQGAANFLAQGRDTDGQVGQQSGLDKPGD
jgi:hypothetical protein